MKRFSFDCDFTGVAAPFDVYVGDPLEDKHPLFYQACWLLEERGGTIPQAVMAAVKSAQEQALRNGEPLPNVFLRLTQAARTSARP
jgi:Domain of unknown function (DUF2610)